MSVEQHEHDFMMERLVTSRLEVFRMAETLCRVIDALGTSVPIKVSELAEECRGQIGETRKLASAMSGITRKK